jgi:hypothetical protein
MIIDQLFTPKKLYEFAPSDDDSNGSDPEELLRRMASYWWNGTEKQMSKVENTLAAMGWEIGQDDGYDDGGVFVVRAGDEHGGSYISWPHEDLKLNEGRKKKNKKTSRSLGRYFFPGYGYYGSGESGEGGGDGGGGESVNPGMEEGEYDSRKPFGVRYKVFAGREGRLTTREYYTSSEEKLQRAVDKIQALDNFYEIDGYSYPKEPQGVAEGLIQPKEAFQAIKNLQRFAQDNSDFTLQQLDNLPSRGNPIKPMFANANLAIDTLIQVYKTRKELGNAEFLKQLKDEINYFLTDRTASSDPITLGDLLMNKLGKINFQQGVPEGLTEMDKSEPSAGRDGGHQSPRDDRQSLGRDTGPRSGPDRYAKPITSKQMQDRALDKLTRAAKDSHKKKDVSEDSISAMRRLAGIVPQVPVIVPDGQRQYRHMPTAVQPR